MVIRTYIDKNNTITKNNLVNTSKNPIAELYYGGDTSITKYTRHLLYFDILDLQTKYSNGEFGDLSNIKHTLKMTNTSLFDNELLGQKRIDSKVRAFSFDLILFKIDKFWDEGCGYDYTKEKTSIPSKNSFIEGTSNWFNATTLDTWNSPGVYSGSPTGITIVTQHFDNGNENIEMDITNEVNKLITGGSVNYGYGIAFDYDLEQLKTEDSNYVGFFTKYTQTYYEPFLESIYTNPIMDDRAKFYKGKTNTLYLYSNLGGQPTNLDNNPSVMIYDEEGNIFSAFTTGDTVHVTKGVYSISFDVPIEHIDNVLFEDVWSDININGRNRPDVTLDFEIKCDSEYYNIGDNYNLPIEYAMTLSGIKREEKIKRGDIRKVIVSARKPYTIEESSVIDNLSYRLYIREGNTEVNVIDWQPINRTFNNNYFLLDTSWMIPNRYYIDIKLTSNDEVKTYKNLVYYDIINQVELH